MKTAHKELDRVNAPDKILQRKEYALWFNNYFQNDLSSIVFVDESSFNLHLKRSKGRSLQGTRSNIIVPTVRGRSISIIGSISISQMCLCKAITNSTVNANVFAEYLYELCSYLKNNLEMENAFIILDNARVHKRDDIDRITLEFGYKFKFLSPYSYMLNPMENAFSKLKNSVRSRLRSSATGSLATIILSEIESISSNDCAGYFRYISRNITNCAAELPYVHL